MPRRLKLTEYDGSLVGRVVENTDKYQGQYDTPGGTSAIHTHWTGGFGGPGDSQLTKFANQGPKYSNGIYGDPYAKKHSVMYDNEPPKGNVEFVNNDDVIDIIDAPNQQTNTEMVNSNNKHIPRQTNINLIVENTEKINSFKDDPVYDPLVTENTQGATSGVEGYKNISTRIDGSSQENNNYKNNENMVKTVLWVMMIGLWAAFIHEFIHQKVHGNTHKDWKNYLLYATVFTILLFIINLCV